MKKPKLQREIKAEKKKVENIEKVRILNKSNQLVNIQLKSPKGTDFFIGEQTVSLYKGQIAEFPKSRLMWEEQIQNLCKKGMIKILR